QTHIRSPLLSAAPISRLRRARAQEGGTILFFGFLSQAKFRSAHLDRRSYQAPEIDKGKAFVFRRPLSRLLLRQPLRSRISRRRSVASSQGNDQYFSNSAAIELYAMMEPPGQDRTGLMPYHNQASWIIVVRSRGFPA